MLHYGFFTTVSLRRADPGCPTWNSNTWEVVGRGVQDQPWVYKILTQKKTNERERKM